MRAQKNIAAAIAASAVLVTLTLPGCKSLLASGSFGNFAKNLKPAPEVSGPAITRKRLRAIDEVESALAAADASAGFTSYATSSDDRCYKGENEWFVRDGYAHRCTLRMTRFYGMSGDFRDQMIAFEDHLVTGGWRLPRAAPGEVPSGSFRDVFENYYDRHCRAPRIAVFNGSQPSCEISSLPRSQTSGYRKGELSLWIEYAERGESDAYMSSDVYMMELVQSAPTGSAFKQEDARYNLYQNTSVQDVKARVREITQAHSYVVSITVEKIYFEN